MTSRTGGTNGSEHEQRKSLTINERGGNARKRHTDRLRGITEVAKRSNRKTQRLGKPSNERIDKAQKG